MTKTRHFLITIMGIALFFSLTGCNVVTNTTTSDPVATTPTTEAKTGNISGTVTYSDGSPMVNALVRDLSLSSVTANATTNSSGQYLLSEIPVGSATINCDGNANVTSYAQGYWAASQAVTVTEGGTTTLNFVMRPKLEMKNVAITQYNSTLDWIQVAGEITNNTTSIKEYVKVTVTFRNSSGTIVGSDFAYVASTDLSAGDTATFTIIISSLKYSDLSGYTVSYVVSSW